jgi:hypothetical protein
MQLYKIIIKILIAGNEQLNHPRDGNDQVCDSAGYSEPASKFNTFNKPKKPFSISSSDSDSQTPIKRVWIKDIEECTEDTNTMFFLRTTEKPKCDRSRFAWSKVKTSKNKTSTYKCIGNKELCTAEKIVYSCNGHCKRLNRLCCDER